MNTNSNSYTIIYASVMVVIVAFLLAFVASVLKPTQDANVAIDKKQQILRSLNLRDVAKADVETTYAKVVLSDPIYGADAATPENDGSATSEKGSVKQHDQSGFKKENKELGESCRPLYVCDVDGQTVYVIPVKGTGLWGGIWGYVSIESDGKTVRSAYFNHESETAGLGAEIKDNANWQHKFDGKKLFAEGDEQTIALSVLKSGKEPDVKAENRVDAVTGATITSTGVNDMIHECLGRYVDILNNLCNGGAATENTDINNPADSLATEPEAAAPAA